MSYNSADVRTYYLNKFKNLDDNYWTCLNVPFKYINKKIFLDKSKIINEIMIITNNEKIHYDEFIDVLFNIISDGNDGRDENHINMSMHHINKNIEYIMYNLYSFILVLSKINLKFNRINNEYIVVFDSTQIAHGELYIYMILKSIQLKYSYNDNIAYINKLITIDFFLSCINNNIENISNYNNFITILLKGIISIDQVQLYNLCVDIMNINFFSLYKRNIPMNKELCTNIHFIKVYLFKILSYLCDNRKIEETMKYMLICGLNSSLHLYYDIMINISDNNIIDIKEFKQTLNKICLYHNFKYKSMNSYRYFNGKKIDFITDYSIIAFEFK